MSGLSNLAERMSFWKKGSIPPTNHKLTEGVMREVRRWEAMLEYTPDASILTQYEVIPVFLYGTLMENYPEAGIVAPYNNLPTLTAFTYSSFSCWKKKLGKLSFPIAMEPTPTPYSLAPANTLKGQLFFLFPEAFYELDKRFRNGVQFTRKLVPICAFNRELKRPMVEYEFEAFMYIGKPEYWEHQFDAGFWFEPVQIMQPNRYYPIPYYFFLWEEGIVPNQEEPPLKLLRPKTISSFKPPRDENGNSTIKGIGDTFETIWEEYDPVYPASIKGFKEDIEPSKQGS